MNSLRRRLFAIALLFFPSVAYAQGPSTDASLAPAGVYEIDKSHARVQWRISHLGLSYYVGWFSSFDATLNFDPSSPSRSSLVASVATQSVTTLDPEFDKEIAGPKFLDHAKGNATEFRSREIELTGPQTGKVTGDLTLRGVTLPFTLDVTFVGGMQSPLKNAYVIGFSATGTIKRSEFGITEYLDFGLGDEVTIVIDCEFDLKS